MQTLILSTATSILSILATLVVTVAAIFVIMTGVHALKYIFRRPDSGLGGEILLLVGAEEPLQPGTDPNPNRMLEVTQGFKRTFKIKPSRRGAAVQVDGVRNVTVITGGVTEELVPSDPLTFVLKADGNAGPGEIEVALDVKVGPEEKLLKRRFTIEVIAAEADDFTVDVEGEETPLEIGPAPLPNPVLANN